MFDKMIRETNDRRASDARRFNDHDRDLCMLCGAYGADKRSLLIYCGYVVAEAVPEAIDIHDVEAVHARHKDGYFLRICKSCRAALLGHLEQWRNERAALRDRPKDHDGHVYDAFAEYVGETIPVRIHGAVVTMTPEQFEEYKSKQDNNER